jgi:threonine/homoserine/homoserine lactone efflux protein
MYILTRSLAAGRREGIVSSVGTFTGGVIHVIAAATGLSAILVTSAVAYQAVRWAGGAYLILLGIRMFRSASTGEDSTAVKTAPPRNPFLQGIVTEVLNPKTALFFLSFVPQFVDPKLGGVFLQFVVLGTITVVLNTSVDVAVAIFAGPVGKQLLASARARRRQRQATGAMMAGLGVYVLAREA